MDQNVAKERTTYLVRLRGKVYGDLSSVMVTTMGADDLGIFIGPKRSEAYGAFALIRARCELPTVNADAEMHLFDKVLKELDNVGA